MVAVEVVVGRGLVGADQVVVGVGRHGVGEHVLAGVLVAAVANEALLVAVVDDRLAAGEEHEGVRQPGAGEQFGVAGAGLIDPLQEVADAAHVVVPEERRHGVGVAVGVGVVVVEGEEVAQAVGGRALGREAARRQLEGEVDGRLQLAGGGELAHERRAELLVEHLAEGEEVVDAPRLGRREDVRAELLPELHVHVLGGVDAEPVDAELLDPERVDVDHPLDHLAALGPQVVEAEEVAVERVLAGEARVAPVVVEQRVVEPRRGS